MNVRNSTLLLSFALAGCSEGLELDVRLVDPCNQDAVSSVDFIRIEPRGTGIDSAQLSTIERVDSFETAPIEIPLVEDFHLVATGHRMAFDAPASALGVSAKIDLTQAEGPVSVQVPFSLLGQFYRTTNLDAPRDSTDRCSTLRQDRFGATATVLPSGLVLVVGGARYTPDGFLEFPRLVEVYDPSTGVFLDGPPGSSRKWELRNGQARRNHTASLLPDGRVLVAGGQAPDAPTQGAEGALRSAFFIDPRDLSDLRISEGGIAMKEARTGHRAAVLDDGRVVLVGGRSLNPTDNRLEAQRYWSSIEVFDPAAGAFLVATGSDGNEVPLAAARYGHSAVAVPGTTDVLVAGGMNASGPVTSVEVVRFAPSGVERVPSADSVGVGAIFSAASVTAEGGVLLSGGYSTLDDVRGLAPQNATDAVEMWAVDPASGAPRRICSANLVGARGLHTVSVVGRRAVFVGGRDPTGMPRGDGEVADLLPISEAASRGNCFAQAPSTEGMTDARAEHAAVVLSTSQEVLVLGGVQRDPGGAMPGLSIASSEVFSDFSRRALVTSP